MHRIRLLGWLTIDLAARKSWCESNDPAFAAKAADVVGLYVDPPAKAIVKAFDPGPGAGAILSEAAERARLDRPEPRLQAARHHDLVRRAEVATGRIIAAHSKRRRGVEFLGFMNSISLPPTRIASFT